jgi:hypothetical protein
MTILNDLTKFRQEVKEQIIKTATEIYLKDNDGLYPNWEEDEEVVLDGSNANDYKITLMFHNTYDESVYAEPQMVEEIRVTLDSNLYFITADGMNESHWSEVNTDELVHICYNLQKTLESMGA